MGEYKEALVAEAFSSPLVEEDLCQQYLGGSKADPATMQRYLALPVTGRPELSVFFDRAFYLRRYRDIADAGVDPLVHFIRWGLAERRAPHPLIDLRHIGAADPDALPDPPSDTALVALLAADRVDPGPYFSLTFYRSQLEGTEAVEGGLLRHFLQYGLLRGLRPVPAFDPLAYYRWLPDKTLDLRSALREFVIRAGASVAPVGVLPEEAQTKLLVSRRATAEAMQYRRWPLDFTCAEPPAVSVVIVAHNNFALTLRTLAALAGAGAPPFELIVIDSGSDDEIRHLGDYVRGATLLRFEQNVQFVRGANAGLELANAQAVLFLNNDAVPHRHALAAALRRLTSAEDIGIVGGKVVRTHGLLQEAGGIVWRNGWTIGYLRDQPPEAPEANFVREVDFVSGVFLLARAEPLRQLGGFSVDFVPAYYEDVDLCTRFRAAGWRVVYDPAVVVEHVEYGSAEPEAAHQQIAKAHAVFVSRHRDRLRRQYASDTRAELFARTTAPARGRVLLIEDRLPLRRLGSGFVRSNDIVAAMARNGFHVTVYGISREEADLAVIYGDFPDTVEVMHDRALADLALFLKRRRGYYDTLWICRTHNLDLLRPLLEAGGVDILGGTQIVLDTEAIAALREAGRRRVLGVAEPFDLPQAIGQELRNAGFCQALVAVSAAEAAELQALGFSGVTVLGHRRPLALTPREWQQREGLLFVGALPAMETPNYDSLVWFVETVLPLVNEGLRDPVRLTVAGTVGSGVEMGRFAAHPQIVLRGTVPELAPLYDSHRLFIAPTRYGAGIPYKVHEAASFGLPVVATDLLCRQLGWEDGRELLVAPATDAAAFAAQIVRLYKDEATWQTLRDRAARKIAADCDVTQWEETLVRILQTRQGPCG
jgi:GT2 family glycosyltransferase/glycosyltransferase involved in cell wall biosynthesis